MFYQILKIELASPPFIDTRRGGVHAQEIAEVIVFSPNRGGAVVEHCRKYTVGYGAWRGSRPGRHPWPCGDRAGVLVAPAGGVAVAVEGTSSRCRVAAFRGPCRLWSCPGQGSVRVQGSFPYRLRVLQRGKYKGSTGSWQHSGWSSAEHVSHSVAGSHSVATAPGMARAVTGAGG